MLFDEVDAAKVGSFQMYLRPLICISIGFFADRSSSAVWLVRGFLLLLIGALLLPQAGWLLRITLSFSLHCHHWNWHLWFAHPLFCSREGRTHSLCCDRYSCGHYLGGGLYPRYFYGTCYGSIAGQ